MDFLDNINIINEEDETYISNESKKAIRAEMNKIRLSQLHDPYFKPGEEIEIRTMQAGIPNRAICVKEYPFHFLFRSIPKEEGRETYNFCINKYMLFAEYGHVRFKPKNWYIRYHPLYIILIHP